MSTNRIDFGNDTYDILCGSEKTIQILVTDPHGHPQNMNSTEMFSYGKAKIFKPGGTIIMEVPLRFVNRGEGDVDFLVDSQYTVIENAGNWIGNIKIYNINHEIVIQVRFGINFLENY